MTRSFVWSMARLPRVKGNLRFILSFGVDVLLMLIGATGGGKLGFELRLRVRYEVLKLECVVWFRAANIYRGYRAAASVLSQSLGTRLAFTSSTPYM